MKGPDVGRPINLSTIKVDDLQSLDIAWLRRVGGDQVGKSGVITWSQAGSEAARIGYKVEQGGIRLHYLHASIGGGSAHVDELIPLATTPMHFGGHRPWFTCLSCGRRCRILYGGKHFRCRICFGAKYESQYQHPAFTVCDRRWRIRKRLEERGGYEWPFGLDDGLPPKPPHMHWRTYHKLEALDDYLDQLWGLEPSGETLIRR